MNHLHLNSSLRVSFQPNSCLDLKESFASGLLSRGGHLPEEHSPDLWGLAQPHPADLFQAWEDFYCLWMQVQSRTRGLSIKEWFMEMKLRSTFAAKASALIGLKRQSLIPQIPRLTGSLFQIVFLVTMVCVPNSAIYKIPSRGEFKLSYFLNVISYFLSKNKNTAICTLSTKCR